jgi:3-phosphoshikimate 1-carboxyvinyltransferase
MLEILGRMGAEVVWDDGIVTVHAERLSGVTVDVREIPDLVPPIAAAACFCRGETRIMGAGRLRHKESDRLRALTAVLRGLGADIAETDDGLRIMGRASLSGGDADAWGDHRIAMAAAVAAIRCTGPVRLTGWECVAKSYPDFWKDFEGE